MAVTTTAVLRTPRLTLRAARLSDVDDLHTIYGNARAMRYWSTPPDPDSATTAERLARIIGDGRSPHLYLLLERAGRVIGTAGCGRGNEVGFILHPDHWRQGLMREAMQAILPHIWAATSLPYLWADADPRNAASIGLLTALGFGETGRARNTFHINGEWCDSVYLGLPRPSSAG